MSLHKKDMDRIDGRMDKVIPIYPKTLFAGGNNEIILAVGLNVHMSGSLKDDHTVF